MYTTGHLCVLTGDSTAARYIQNNATKELQGEPLLDYKRMYKTILISPKSLQLEFQVTTLGPVRFGAYLVEKFFHHLRKAE